MEIKYNGRHCFEGLSCPPPQSSTAELGPGSLELPACLLIPQSLAQSAWSRTVPRNLSRNLGQEPSVKLSENWLPLCQHQTAEV